MPSPNDPATAALAIQQAKVELQAKTIEQIHYETAMVWLARALAAHSLFADNRSIHYLRDAEHYAHESLEHAALSDQGSAVVSYVETMLVPLRRSLGR